MTTAAGLKGLVLCRALLCSTLPGPALPGRVSLTTRDVSFRSEAADRPICPMPSADTSGPTEEAVVTLGKMPWYVHYMYLYASGRASLVLLADRMVHTDSLPPGGARHINSTEVRVH